MPKSRPKSRPSRSKTAPAGASKRSAPGKRPARIEVQIAARYAAAVSARSLEAAARAALDAARIRRRVALTVVVTGDAALRRLNRDFAGLDAPTDVLSFAADEAPEYLGDVIVSLPRARAQARRGRHPLVDELRLLVIHGVLHLLGHDHHSPAQRERMWAIQARALRKVGASIEGPGA